MSILCHPNAAWLYNHCCGIPTNKIPLMWASWIGKTIPEFQNPFRPFTSSISIRNLIAASVPPARTNGECFFFCVRILRFLPICRHVTCANINHHIPSVMQTINCDRNRTCLNYASTFVNRWTLALLIWRSIRSVLRCLYRSVNRFA